MSNLSDDAHDVLAERSLTKDVRDPAVLVERVAEWLAGPLGATGTVQVTDVHAPSGNGMSCVTLVMACAWQDEQGAHKRPLVTRIPPDTDSFPVFPDYDMSLL